MARRSPKLTVVITAAADRELTSIWDYNAEYRSLRQADAWDSFLRTKIAGLATGYADGRPIEDFSNLRRILVKRRSQANGHYVIYEVDQASQVVNILHIYHSSMDVEGRLKREFE